MLAVAASELPRDEENWAAEIKWDGMRGLAYIAAGRLLLRSRGGRDITGIYPELSALAAAKARSSSGSAPGTNREGAPVRG
jgi:bifunctional non-homologous end joining protein LigD